MKSIRYYGISDVRYEDVEMPSYGDCDVLIKVCYAGICGSDLHIYRKGMFVTKIPETMGHEFVGIVAEVGKNVKGIKPGELVSANPMVNCMTCKSCIAGNYNICENLGFIGEVRPGCFAEYVSMPEDKIIRISEKASEIANIKKYVLVEPLAVAINVSKRADLNKKDKIAIIGAGPIGTLLCAVLKQIQKINSVTMVDICEDRLLCAKAAGADYILTDSNLMDDDYDAVIDCAGVGASISAAALHVRGNGKVCIVSVFENATGIDCNDIVNKQLNIIGCNVYNQSDMNYAAEILGTEDLSIEFIITNEFAMENCKEAFELLAGQDKKAQKVIFKVG